MAYEKRICVMKQIKRGFSADGSALSGAVHAERWGKDATFTVRLLGLAPVREGRYALAVCVGGRTEAFDLDGKDSFRMQDAPSLKDGFSALVCFVRGEAEAVAYGFCGNAPSDHLALLKGFSEGEKKKRKRPIPVPLPPNQIPGAPSPQVPLAPAVPLPDREGYDDEALAADDYFRGKRDVCEGDENETAACGGQRETAQKEGGRLSGKDGAGDVFPPFRVARGTTYYESVREKLEEAFRKYPKDTRLSGTFPHSEWVNAGAALLGIVYEEGLPRYLCLAAEGKDGPPEEMKGEGVFVPLNPFSEDEGFYVLFQDAETGETVKTYDA